MTDLFEKKLIVNGSVNPSITLDEILEHFGTKDYIDAAWNIAVHLNVYYGQDLVSHDSVCEAPKESLVQQWENFEVAKRVKQQELADKEFKEGKELFNFIKNFNNQSKSFEFCDPSIPMSPNQALGYFSNTEQWNHYSSSLVSRAVNKIESFSIRADYGVNNPNTGNLITTYVKSGDHLLVSFKVTEEKQDAWLEKHKIHITLALESASTCSVRVVRKKFEVTFVAYWG